jgi:hypothetical protein
VADESRGWHQVGKTVDWVAGRYREGMVTAEYEVVHEGVVLVSLFRPVAVGSPVQVSAAASAHASYS